MQTFREFVEQLNCENYVLTVKSKHGKESFWYKDKEGAEQFRDFLKKDKDFKNAEMSIDKEKKPSKEKFVGDNLKAQAKKLKESLIEVSE